jgi:hypothetical protein
MQRNLKELLNMTATEQMMWNRNDALTNENLMLIRAMALVLISPNHETAIQAAKEAFAQMEVNDPFKPVEVGQDTEEVKEVAA